MRSLCLCERGILLIKKDFDDSLSTSVCESVHTFTYKQYSPMFQCVVLSDDSKEKYTFFRVIPTRTSIVCA